MPLARVYQLPLGVMPKPGNVSVTTEVGYCPFCGRTRNLRREERRLGGLVRATLECESCHRTLSSTMGPVAEPPAEQAAPQVEEAEVDAVLLVSTPEEGTR